ncbi:hypothetical protein MVLG_04437 [Microbotryum lychnidis-dioicae p1A1 Lamole]|uniref:Domain of unknown function at the cortex 1 domain-containing protein n=2 Tax=Microbotryum lychnidis-dioicae (strain p1A1 Lamole / MvSl-1064) TaxID=683840 RepID=U5HB80_USTV1|nr:hypothetical protein MVLG_04437 [Microbotryum lychnidis-dioicae p1A1 Lamole]|eukprot:KDE05196.1 hypothetical protein MVLG_04437 [Microbotryum lychnidis-dioicae p1A1 Lamole]
MTPRIICKAGPSVHDLKPVAVNGAPIKIKAAGFEGRISVRLSNFHGTAPGGGEAPSQPKTEYTTPTDTMSISFCGRFTEESLNADDVLWGNQWEQPIRDYLPYGTAAALKIAPLIDPALTHDIYADRPWALSPLLATMQHIQAEETDPSATIPDYTPGPVNEDISILFENEANATKLHGKPDQRRKWMANAEHRKLVKLNKKHLLTCDFSNGFIDFANLSLKLPGGLKFSLEKYWDGQPVTFVCRKRESIDHVYFVITFELEGDKRSQPNHEEVEKKEEQPTSDEVVEAVDELGID